MGISDREAEVLALVGEHLSNAEIAARLFISVRTVETHVSSLLRKLGAPDRRALAQVAADRARAGQADDALAVLPSPLTSFVGRVRERAALADTLKAHRQVTAVGPGGVGKTRLVLAVAADLAGEFADGVWFVDLVPVTDPAMVGAAVAGALGVGERQGQTIDEAVRATLADRQTLLVLDNCEHVPDGVAPFAERLLGGCPRLTVLATSRARLMVPYERVFPVPPMSLAGDDAGESDAVALFLERAAAVGWPVDPPLRDQAAGICQTLDGVALAIELAAARLPVLGLDGLAAGLSDQLRLLAGGSRADDRHRSVRTMLDWSHSLLDAADQTLLRRISAFVSPFTADAAAEVAGFAPLAAGAVVEGLAHLAEQSLLVVVPSATGTRYRALETIRQYGVEQLTEAGDLTTTRVRHLRWCLAGATRLARDPQPETGAWRAGFDAAADDIRAALGWAADQPDHRGEACQLALTMAELTFTRSLLGESQQRYEQAAGLADDLTATVAALRLAAGAAHCRLVCDETFRLLRAAAEAARSGGDDAGAARCLAEAVTARHRFQGCFTTFPTPDEVDGSLSTARELAGDDPTAQAALAIADTFIAQDDPTITNRAQRAVELARQVGDPLVESAALDGLTAARLAAGDMPAAVAAVRRRSELLTPLPLTVANGGEVLDMLGMATEANLGLGDLPAARRSGEQMRDLRFVAEEGHIASSRLLVVDALAGNVDAVVTASARLREGWERAGRPLNMNLGPAAAAVAMIQGLAGNDEARAEWLAIVDGVGATPERLAGYGAAFHAVFLLHRGQAAEALATLAHEPEELRSWYTGLWRQWYAALQAEAAVLADHVDAGRRIAAARTIAAGNPVASAIVDRAEALPAGDQERLLTTAAAFEAAGCRYQWARTLVLAGGRHHETGSAALSDLGIAPMGGRA